MSDIQKYIDELHQIELEKEKLDKEFIYQMMSLVEYK